MHYAVSNVKVASLHTCFLSERAENHAKLEYTSRPVENSLNSTGTKEGRTKATSLVGIAAATRKLDLRVLVNAVRDEDRRFTS